MNYTEVNAGWSLYPVAYLPGQSTFEMQITSGKFEADLFVMTNSTEFTKTNTYKMPMTETLPLSATGEIELKYTPISNDTEYPISVYGGFNADERTTQKFIQTTAADPTTGKYTLSGKTMDFLPEDFTDAGNKVTVSYFYEEVAREANIDNRSSAIGEAILSYPVYGDAEECRTDSSIIGHVVLKVYKARVTAQPGLDGSYKSASTFQFTLAAMDAKRSDNATYSIAYIEA